MSSITINSIRYEYGPGMEAIQSKLAPNYTCYYFYYLFMLSLGGSSRDLYVVLSTTYSPAAVSINNLLAIPSSASLTSSTYSSAPSAVSTISSAPATYHTNLLSNQSTEAGFDGDGCVAQVLSLRLEFIRSDVYRLDINYGPTLVIVYKGTCRVSKRPLEVSVYIECRSTN